MKGYLIGTIILSLFSADEDPACVSPTGKICIQGHKVKLSQESALEPIILNILKQ